MLLEKHGTRWRRLRSAAFDGRFRAAMKEAVDVARGLFLERPAADRSGGPAAGDRPRIIQPRRVEGARKDRASGLQRARARPAISKIERVGLLLGAITPPGIFAGRMTLEDSYAWAKTSRESQAKNFYYSFLLLPVPKRRAMCADLRVHALLRRFER